MKKISLFVNGELGLRILDELISREDCEVHLIILNSEEKKGEKFKEELESRKPSLKKSVIIESFYQEIWENVRVKDAYNDSTHVLSILFGHIIPAQYLNKRPGCILNFHPSLLPTGRGADPVAWSILEGKEQGVSIHEITENLDSGRLVYQKKIKTDLSATANSVYTLAMEELWVGFKSIVDAWINGGLILENPATGGSYHKSRELIEFKESLLLKSELLEKAIRTVNALNYADGRRALFRDSTGITWQVEVNLVRIED